MSSIEFHPHCKLVGLTHLMFADDLIIFCKAKPIAVQLLMEAFKVFTSCTGLKANLDKSQIVFRGECTAMQKECLEVTGFAEGKLPLKYLGMPITASRLTKVECRLLGEKITARILTWTTKHISYARRVVLVNTILVGMYSYRAQIFIIPQVVNQVIKVCRNFFGGGGDAAYKKAPYISWDIICQPKKHEGLGVKNLNIWNIACVAKLIWAVAKKKDILWVQRIHGRYLKGKDWWNYSPKGDTRWY